MTSSEIWGILKQGGGGGKRILCLRERGGGLYLPLHSHPLVKPVQNRILKKNIYGLVAVVLLYE